VEDISKYGPGVLLLPTIDNFAAIDALITPDVFFQFTTNSTHPIKGDRLLEIIEQLSKGPKDTKKIKLIFVVPTGIYKGFRFQKYTAKDANRNISEGNKHMCLEFF
jgi:hypothetical protein